jgi:hypothetical protein
MGAVSDVQDGFFIYDFVESKLIISKGHLLVLTP